MADTVDVAKKRLFHFSVWTGWTCTLLVLCIQVFFVAPRFSLLYADGQEAIPRLTSFVIQLSNMAVGSPIATIFFLLLTNVIFAVCTYLVRRKESPWLYFLYAFATFLFGGIVNVIFFAALYLPIFSQ